MEKLEKERKEFESLGLIYAPHSRVKIEKTILADVENYWFTPSKLLSEELIIYLHGGGFIYGGIESHRAMVSHFSHRLGRSILFVEYALAPEYPFPFALTQTTSVIRELLRQTPDLLFALMGDSAGGNLVMSTALNLQNLKIRLPSYQILISPWTNMDTSYSSYSENEKNDPILTREFMKSASSFYSNAHSLSDPLISPVFGSFQSFGATLILVGENEILRDDSIQLHETLTKSGCTSVLKIFKAVTHVWTLTDIESSDSKLALQMMNEFTSTIANIAAAK